MQHEDPPRDPWETCAENAAPGEGRFQFYVPEIEASRLPALAQVIGSAVAIDTIVEDENSPVSDGLEAAINRLVVGWVPDIEVDGSIGDATCTVLIQDDGILISTDSDGLFNARELAKTGRERFRAIVSLAVLIADVAHASGVYAGQAKLFQYDAESMGIPIYRRETALAAERPNSPVGDREGVSSGWSPYLARVERRLFASRFEPISALPLALEADCAYRRRQSRVFELQRRETVCFFGYAHGELRRGQLIRFTENVLSYASDERDARGGQLRVYAIVGCRGLTRTVMKDIWDDEVLPQTNCRPIVVNFDTKIMHHRARRSRDSYARRGIMKEMATLFAPERRPLYPPPA